MRSIWSINDIQKKDKREPLPEHISAAVIGGGMAGILCAWFLMESGVDTVVLEAGTVGSGQTEGTTAKITSQHGMFCHRFLEKKGEEKARNYVQANQEAFRQYDKYHRCQGREGTVAIIPAVHLSSGNGSCSVQVITPKESLYREFPLSQFWINRTKGIMQIGDNLFSDLQPIWELQ